jgi:hypothetical protein
MVVLAACGGDDDSTTTIDSSTPPTAPATQPTTVPSTSTSPSTSATTTTSTTTSTSTVAPTTAATSGCDAAPIFDPSGPIRDQWVDHLVNCGFTADEAGCLFDHIKFDDPDVAAGDPEAMLPAFQACFIDQSRIDEIGGG